MDTVDLVNLALQSFGNRTTLTSAQLTAGSNNEAKQANLCFANVRDTLLRMAPWDCAMKTANLTYITSVPGTPENTSPATTLWAPGQPRPPWAYEYQYPVDCLRACWIIPATQTGYAGGVPITTAVTGGAPTLWNGGPIRFKVGVDQFLVATVAAPSSGGSGYVNGDLIYLAAEAATADTTNILGTFLEGAPQGAPAILRVTSAVAGAVVTVEIVSQIPDEATPAGGSYFFRYLSGDAAQASTSGSGTGATFGLDIGISTVRDQRVIYTNQEFASLCYVKKVPNPNVWDPMFQDAFIQALGANICFGLSGDKGLMNACIARANAQIAEARKVDGNEGLTINDVTPDWIRARGITWTDGMVSGPYSGFEWGAFLPSW